MQPHLVDRFAKVNITAEEICVWRRIGRRERTKADRSGDDLRTEWENSVDIVEAEGLAGAMRFSGGKGRHGDYSDIGSA